MPSQNINYAKAFYLFFVKTFLKFVNAFFRNAI